jgi:hypothetical protein
VLLEAGRADESARDLQLALQVMPASKAAQAQLGIVHNMLGVALQREGRADEAIAHLKQALAITPGLTGALVNWGNALETRGDLEGAREKYREAIRREPAMPQAWLNAASVAVDLGRNAEAREAYARVLAIDPGSADARYGLGLLDLREQRFGDGWDGYERRFDTHPPQSTRRGPALPALEARDLDTGKRVAVWSEMGVGDQVLYSTLLPELRERAAHVVAEVDPRLLAAYRRSLPAIEFVARGDAIPPGSCDRQVGVGSLAQLLRRDSASFARQPRALLLPMRHASRRSARSWEAALMSPFRGAASRRPCARAARRASPSRSPSSRRWRPRPGRGSWTSNTATWRRSARPSSASIRAFSCASRASTPSTISRA